MSWFKTNQNYFYEIKIVLRILITNNQGKILLEITIKEKSYNLLKIQKGKSTPIDCHMLRHEYQGANALIMSQVLLSLAEG